MSRGHMLSIKRESYLDLLKPERRRAAMLADIRTRWHDAMHPGDTWYDEKRRRRAERAWFAGWDDGLTEEQLNVAQPAIDRMARRILNGMAEMDAAGTIGPVSSSMAASSPFGRTSDR